MPSSWSSSGWAPPLRFHSRSPMVPTIMSIMTTSNNPELEALSSQGWHSSLTVRLPSVQLWQKWPSYLALHADQEVCACRDVLLPPRHAAEPSRSVRRSH